MGADLATEYAEAVAFALDAVSRKHGAGSLNSAIGALVSVQAELIASVSERRARRALVEAIERTLPKEIAKYQAREPRQNVITLKVQGGVN